jgi:hypothetical protein
MRSTQLALGNPSSPVIGGCHHRYPLLRGSQFELELKLRFDDHVRAANSYTALASFEIGGRYSSVPVDQRRALDRLGRAEESTRLIKRFEDFAAGALDAKDASHRGEARYLPGLVRMRAGRLEEGREWLRKALEAQPDFLSARLELRGDALDLARPKAN